MKLKHWIVFIVLGLIWSSSFMWIKIVVSTMGPSTLVAYRALFGLLFGVGTIIYMRQRMITKSEWVPLLVIGLTNIAIPFFLISWGEKSIDSGIAAILDATVPLFAIVGAHIVLPDDKITWPKVIGLLMGFIGVMVLMSKDLGAHSSTWIGQLAVIVASLFYAGSGIIARKYTQDIPSSFRATGPLVSAFFVMWVVALTTESPIVVPNTIQIWVALIWLGILGSGLAFVMLFYLIHEIGPTRTSMVTYLFPLGGVTLGVIFLGEPLTWQIVSGAVLISVSLVVANWQTGQADHS
jgi:drug/metabolite transporter (DMT)-like permease